MSRSGNTTPPGSGGGDSPSSEQELAMDITAKRSEPPSKEVTDENSKVTPNPDLAGNTLREPGLTG